MDACVMCCISLLGILLFFFPFLVKRNEAMKIVYKIKVIENNTKNVPKMNRVRHDFTQLPSKASRHAHSLFDLFKCAYICLLRILIAIVHVMFACVC